MKLGDDTIGLRTRRPSGERDDRGNDILVEEDVEVPWCLVVPTTSSEAADRGAPTVSGAHVYAPPGTDLEATAAVIWPITGRESVDGRLRLSGTTWEVDGEAGVWPELVEAQLRRAT